ncbi:amino acid permease [Pedobacter psychrophilus]|uniref:Amino acid permease n=1 Tax=Pedobacter psychrophilus TaxID=1826909 RepID=A0A179DMQ9_9SPHI|nr:APC family permease [Pedobacter psychrophilus]OAQ41753.1 amino acid permease [Pedobacter psychrophilus]
MKEEKKLGELASTAICGNDISSSVLYVSALAIGFAGQYAWITLLIVAVVLFSFRKIYGEVVGALPLNGGAYNALLNTTSKSMASLAACLTILSYMATAVISANEAMHYLAHLIPSLPIIIATIVILAIFAFLTISGITESAKVAIGIFLFHLVTMVVLIGSIILYIFNIGIENLLANWHRPLTFGSIGMAIFFGFAASMLGISGFESSANFVEEQKKGVFPKTLRNMWIVVSVLNPLIAFLAICVLPIPEIKLYSNALLSQIGLISTGEWLAFIISIDAVLVLSGAVLTSFIGVSGLLERITLDRIMPNFFLKKNKKGSSYRIIILFFLLSVSVLLITKGNVTLLAGVYTLSFLSVMALFVIGNMLLKIKRKRLPRPEKAKWTALIFALVAVTCAIIGNILIVPENPAEPRNVVVFLEYFIPTILFLVIMLNRTTLLKFLINFIQYLFAPIKKAIDNSNLEVPLRRAVVSISRNLQKNINRINQQEFVFFTKGDNVANLNHVMNYIRNNEHTKKIRIVTILKEGEKVAENLETDINVLDRMYPEIDIHFIKLMDKFGPELIDKLSNEWHIPPNFMFIGSPGDRFPYRIEELGGVRLII